MAAVGNPFGLGSVTAGIISALGRDINEGSLRRFPANRRTDQPRQFRRTGIYTAIYSPSGGSVGIGFAVPSNIAKQVVVQLNGHCHVS
jgi:serine protease Do